MANANVSAPEFSSAYSGDEKDLQGQDSVPFPPSSRSSISVPYSPESPNASTPEGLSSSQVTPNAAADNFAHSAQHGLGGGIDETGIPYNQLINIMYPSFDPSGGFASQPYRTVDPTMLLGVDRDGGHGQSYAHPSPSSDGWGFNSSSTASPEPLAASSSSTPPSAAESAPGRNVTGRKISGPKRLSQDSTGAGRAGGVLSPLTPIQQKKKSSLSNSAVASASRQAAPRSSASPDQGQSGTNNSSNAGASTDDADSVPTVCTNCQTTNTPLWRRDPEGQPLCKFTGFFPSVIF